MARMQAHSARLSQNTAVDGRNGSVGLSDLDIETHVGRVNMANQKAALGNVTWNQRMYGYGG